MLIRDLPATDRSTLATAQLCANVPVAELERSRRFYGEVLGLRLAFADARRGLYFRGADGLLNVYEREAAPGTQAVATFIVADLAAEKRRLDDAGVAFEDYDLPDLKTRDGVYRDDTGFAVAWFRDPDGHLLAVEKHPTEF